MIKELKNKKIVMLLTNDFTHDSRVLKEALSAKKAGMKVTVLALKSINTPFFENRNGVQIIRIKNELLKSTSIKDKSKLTKKIVLRKPKLLSFLGRNLNYKLYFYLYNIWVVNRVFYQEVKKINPDLVHANDTDTLLAGYRLKKDGIPLVYDAHELYIERLNNPPLIWKYYFNLLEKKLSNINALFTVNQSISNQLKKRYNLKNKPTAILYNAPFIHMSKIDNKTSVKKIRIVYLGNYQANRGLEQVVNAMAGLPIKLFIYGKNFPLISQKNIIVKNPVEPLRVVQTAKQYDVGILPYLPTNLNNLYSTPNKLFEYTMAGLAIISSDLPEIKKLIRRYQNGIIYNPDYKNDLIGKLMFLSNHPEKVLEFKQNSLKMAKKFCWENQAEKQLKIYEKVLNVKQFFKE